MTVSILIVNWKSKDYLRRCLESIRSTCSGLNPGIVVVDGGSFDGCGEMLAKEYPSVNFVQSAQNVGFGRSNNLGFERVTGEAVLLLNPDTELTDGAVSALLATLEERPTAGILGPRLLNSDYSLQTTCVQSLPTPLNQALDSEFLRRVFPWLSIWGTYGIIGSQTPVEAEAVSGACMLVRSVIFKSVGGFSPEYFMYGEDMDLCAKVRRQGFQVLHVPAAQVIHHGGGSSGGSFSEYSAIIMRESVRRFIRSHHGALAAIRYRFLMAITSVIRIPILAVACVMSGKPKFPARRSSLRKWTQILRWSTGVPTAAPDTFLRHAGNPNSICAASPAK